MMFSGVRSSCDSVATKSDLMRFARSISPKSRAFSRLMDGLLHVWDVRASPPALALEAAVGDGAVVLDAVAFTAPGASAGELRSQRIVTVTSDGWVRRWSLDVGEVAGRASRRLAALRPN